MKLKPLSPIFDSKKYLQTKMRDIDSLSGAFHRMDEDGEMIHSPSYDIKELYKGYFKMALAGEITEAVLMEHQEDYENKKLAWVQPTQYQTISYEENDQKRIDHVALNGDVFDFFNPLRPLVNQFALFAAISNAYLKTGQDNQSLGFAIRAAEVWGKINRFEAEYLNRPNIEIEVARPIWIESAQHKFAIKQKKIADSAKGGKAKGKKSEILAKRYWEVCKTNPQYEMLLKKHPRMGRKFSDELFEFLKKQERKGSLEEIPYGAAWFYENVTLKYRIKK